MSKCVEILFSTAVLRNNCISSIISIIKKALYTESAFCIKGEKFRGTTFVSHFDTAARSNSCLLNADQTGTPTSSKSRLQGPL